jgi:hypothetical protein
MDLDTLRPLIEQLLHHDRPRYQRLWAYYRNTLQLGPCPASASQIERPYYQAQEWGMPARITGLRPGGTTFEPKLLPGVSRKQVVIENDIAWRIDTMVDYLFGKSSWNPMRPTPIAGCSSPNCCAPSSRGTAGCCSFSSWRCSAQYTALSMCW